MSQFHRSQKRLKERTRQEKQERKAQRKADRKIGRDDSQLPDSSSIEENDQEINAEEGPAAEVSNGGEED